MNHKGVLQKPRGGGEGGQLSIDVLFAIIALAIFFAVLVNTYNDRLTTQAGEQSISNEARAILLDVYTAVGSVQAYGQSVDYAAPSPRQKNANNQILPCTITINKATGLINVGIRGDTGAIDRNYLGLGLGSVRFSGPPGGPEIFSFACGTGITISKA